MAMPRAEATGSKGRRKSVEKTEAAFLVLEMMIQWHPVGYDNVVMFINKRRERKESEDSAYGLPLNDFGFG